VPTVNSYFSGAGLMEVGFEQAGLHMQHSYEIDSASCQVHRANFSHEVIECDITDKLVGDDHADVFAFTYPCTKYSTIADIHGTRTGDELFLHALRHTAIASPEVYVIENVPGMRAFPIVMEAMTQLPDYYIQTFCPVKSETWLPQRRDRLIIFATKSPFTFRPPEHGSPVRLTDIVEADPVTTWPDAIRTRMTGGYRDKPIISNPQRGDIAPTCVAHYAKDKSTRLLADRRFPMGVRPYSVREWARLQGLPDSFVFPVSNTEAYKQIGNGVSVPVGKWIGDELQRYFGRGRPAGPVDPQPVRERDAA
jgi:DNA (cytosine-5)-methyltransferase 1